jgi:hypothetical protein
MARALTSAGTRADPARLPAGAAREEERSLSVKNSGMVPFVRLFPRQGMAETCTLTIRGSAILPDDEYGLLESYRVDPGCNCRRVMINVASRSQQAILASISYAFDRDDEFAGPFLDPLNPQSRYADVLLDVVEKVLADPASVARLENHCNQVKRAMSDPPHPSQKMLPRSSVNDRARPPRSRTRMRTRRSWLT